MVPEATQVAGLRQDCQSIDRSYPGDLAQELIVLMVCQQQLRDMLDAVAFTDQASTLAIIMRNMLMATASSAMGNATDEQAVS